MPLLGSNGSQKNNADIKLFLRDLIEKNVIEETDILIIEDNQNTKRVTVKNFVESIIEDEGYPTKYRLYSSEKIQNMIDILKEYLQTGVGQMTNIVNNLDKNKASKEELKLAVDTLLEEIETRANSETIMEMIESKMPADKKFTSSDFDTSSDDYKIKLENLSREVINYMVGATPIPSNRPPKGGWVTEDFADESITFGKLSEDYRYGGHFTEGNVNDFVKDGIYTLGSQVLGIPKDDDDDENQVRLLTVETTSTNIVKQKVEYINDLKYRPIYRRVSTINRLRITPFIRVEEVNDKFKVHRDILSDDFNNCGILTDCDIFSITREGHYLADTTVMNLPSKSTYEVSVDKFADRIIYTAMEIGNLRCDIYQAMQYYTVGMNPVNTQWFNTSNYSRSKFEGKTVHLFGDGILFGLGSSDIPNLSIPALLSSKYGLRVINNALGEATAGSYDDETLMERNLITQVSLDPMTDADYAIIMIGTHDWDCAKATLGKTNSDSDLTYKGSLNKAINIILEKNANTKILLVSPFFRSRITLGDDRNSDDYTRNDLYLSEMADAMEDVAVYNHLPFINLYRTSGINRFNSTAYLQDGLYLNDAGHELITDKILDAMNRYY